MNFICDLSDKQRATLSTLGLNCYRLKFPLSNEKRATVNDIYFTVLYCKEKILRDDDDILDEIIESRFFKRETLFKGIWKYKSNINPNELYNIICENENKKRALLERLDLMLNILHN